MFAAGAAIVLAGTAQADTEMVAGFEWTYELVNDKTATITNTECFAGSVVIPSKLGGKPVTAIGPNVFKDKEFLERVTIPAGVTAIGENAFSGCELLRAVKIPDSVTAIGASAFSGCSSLVCVDLGKKVNAIGESAFGNCAKLDAIVFRGNAPTDAADRLSRERPRGAASMCPSRRRTGRRLANSGRDCRSSLETGS